MGHMNDLADALIKAQGLAVAAEARATTAEQRATRLEEALSEWVAYFDSLDRHSHPNDPAAKMRQQYHGARIAKSRTALAETKV